MAFEIRKVFLLPPEHYYCDYDWESESCLNWFWEKCRGTCDCSSVFPRNESDERKFIDFDANAEAK